MVSKQPIFNIQIVRLVAALLVLFSHVQHEAQKPNFLDKSEYTPWSPIYFAGGVDIFFVISGFIMYHISKNDFFRPKAPQKFMLRRLVRVATPYWIFTTAMIGAVIIFEKHVTHSALSFWHILASYFFIPFENAYGKMYPILMLGWTLNFEIFFYFIFALALSFKVRDGLIFIYSVIASFGLIGAFIPPESGPLAFWCNPIVFEFLMGISLALLWETGVRWSMRTGLTILCIGFAAMYWLKETGISEHYWAARPLWMGLPALAICASAALTRESAQPNIFKRILVFGGDASYALYLSHPFALNTVILICGYFGWKSAWSYVWLACIVSLMVAVAVHLTLEKPVTSWLNKITSPYFEKIY